MNRKDRMDSIKTEKENERRQLEYLAKIERDNGDIDSEWFHRHAKSDRECSTRGLYRLIEKMICYSHQQNKLIEKQNKLIEDQGKQQIEMAIIIQTLKKLIQAILKKLEGE